MNFAVCAPTSIPITKTCINTNTNDIFSSLNTSVGPFVHTATDTNQSVSVCAPIPYTSGIGKMCLGITNNFDPFVSIGASIGMASIDYSINIESIVNKIIGLEPHTMVVTNNGSIVTQNGSGDVKTTITMGKASIVAQNSRDNSPIIMQSSGDDAKTIYESLDKCNNMLNDIQTKTLVLMEKHGITIQDIAKSVPVTPIMNTMIAVDNMMAQIRIEMPNFTIFDVCDRINQNAINVSDVLEIIRLGNQNSGIVRSLQWRVDKTIRERIMFYPDCCEVANQGMCQGYHIVNKIDYCRICMTPFRLEYFL